MNNTVTTLAEVFIFSVGQFKEFEMVPSRFVRNVYPDLAVAQFRKFYKSKRISCMDVNSNALDNTEC